MGGWTNHKGKVVLLDRDNIDTDQLIPARFMSTPRSEGYGQYLLHDLRHDADGNADPDFPLTAHPDATILLAGKNFGSGSSREAAVYALVDAGFRAVIAPDFGDIFASNAVNNGLLPATVTEIEAETVAIIAQHTGEPVEVNIAERSITVAEHLYHFDLPDNWATKLINGWDDIDLTLRHADAISDFRNRRQSAAAWAWPAAPETG